MVAILGIDPGAKGGFALGSEETTHWKMPESERDVYESIHTVADVADFAYIEAVHSMPGQGVASMFKFGMNYGMLRAFLIALGIPFETITPAKWQGVLQCRSGGDKKVTYRRAQELFPAIKVTHYIADALLIMEYGRRLRNV